MGWVSIPIVIMGMRVESKEKRAGICQALRFNPIWATGGSRPLFLAPHQLLDAVTCGLTGSAVEYLICSIAKLELTS
jgi:hypothetical protein